MRVLSVGLSDGVRLRPISTGRDQPHGVSLQVTRDAAPRILEWMARGTFDVGEYSLSDYLRSFAAGAHEYTALPVFPHRAFRHSMPWVRSSSPLTRLEELRGGRLGIGAYATTALMFLRGILQDDHDIAPADVTWVRTEPERVPIDVPGVRIEDGHGELETLLESGDVDAIAAFRPPAASNDVPPRARRLLFGWQEIEADYHTRTGIFPIMHVIVLRTSVDESDPTIAPRLAAAFDQAPPRTEVGRDDLQPSWLKGVEPNRRTLEAAVRYARTQYGITLPDDVAELFPASFRT